MKKNKVVHVPTKCSQCGRRPLYRGSNLCERCYHLKVEELKKMSRRKLDGED